MRFEPEVQNASIVLIGNFNPVIFSPAWLEKNGVISESELDAVKQESVVVHPEVTRFKIDTLQVDIVPTRLAFISSAEPYVSLLDSILILFNKLLPHTPVNKFGINLDVHFKFDSPSQRIKFGRALAPVAPWGNFGKRLDAEEFEKTGGLVSITMSEQGLEDREQGWRHVKVERSPLIAGNVGVFVQVNDHFEMPSTKPEDGASNAMDLLENRFDASILEGKRIVDDLMDYGAHL